MSEQVGSDNIRYTTKELLSEIRSELVGVRQDVSDRYHKMAGTVEGLLLRVALVEERHAELANDVRALSSNASDLRDLRERVATSEKVQDALRRQQSRGFSVMEKLIALALGSGTFALLVVDKL